MLITQTSQQKCSRSRLLLVLGIMVVILLGLASRKYPFLFPTVLGKYPGDVLWSLMVYLGWSFLKPETPPIRIATYTLITSYLDEFSQLIQIPWLNATRHTTLGHLILGTGFGWYDLVAYAVGVGVGLLSDKFIFKPASNSLIK